MRNVVQGDIRDVHLQLWTRTQPVRKLSFRSQLRFPTRPMNGAEEIPQLLSVREFTVHETVPFHTAWRSPRPRRRLGPIRRA